MEYFTVKFDALKNVARIAKLEKPPSRNWISAASVSYMFPLPLLRL